MNKRRTAWQMAKGKCWRCLFIFAFCLLPFAMPSAVCAKVLDRTVATVNAQAIMLSEYEKNAAPILEQFKKASPSVEQTPERIADIKKRVLDQMIDDRLLIQEAKKKRPAPSRPRLPTPYAPLPTP